MEYNLQDVMPPNKIPIDPPTHAPNKNPSFSLSKHDGPAGLLLFILTV
jgi:hypothetical protein